MIKVVSALYASLNTTPCAEDHELNVSLKAGALAVIETVSPTKYVPDPSPFSTVTANDGLYSELPVTVTSLAGMTNVVTALEASVKFTSEDPVQPKNAWSSGMLARISTMAPSV